MKRWLIWGMIGSAMLASCLTASANDRFYIRNKPFKGSVVGIGHDPANIRIELKAACEALGIVLTEINGNYEISSVGRVPALPPGVQGTGHLYVGVRELAFTRDDGRMYVNLKELGTLIGAEFVYNRELDTLDMSMTRYSRNGVDNTNWGTAANSPYKLIYFGNDKVAPASKHFRPILQQIEKDSHVPVVWVDTEQPSSDVFLAYIHFFDGNQIPYTVLVNPQDKVVLHWTGSIPYNKFIIQLRGAVKR